MQSEVCVAVDFGGTKLMIGAVTREGGIRASKVYKTGFLKIRQAADAVLVDLDDFLENELPVDCRVICVGMGLVGQINHDKGIWEKLYDLDADGEIQISSIVSGRYHVPCVIENDVKAALAAERRLGAGLESTDFIYINIGTGIAAGIVCDGRVLRGRHNNAGEIGFFPSTYVKGRKIEDCASGRGIWNRLKAIAEEASDTEALRFLEKDGCSLNELYKLVDSGNVSARRVTDEASEELANMCEHLIYTCSPDQIIFGGGVMNCDRMLQSVREKVRVSQYDYKTEIRLTRLDLKTIGLVGAAMIGFEAEEIRK